MKLLVYYTDYHWDNYQGGSGKYIDFKYVIDIPEDFKAGDIISHVHKEMRRLSTLQRQFKQDNYPKITKLEIL